jgi:alpha-beta hydrolase superfamily lysophospholipase
MPSREGRFADGRLFYRAWEVDEPRAAVILAHGYAEHSGRYQHVAAALNAASLAAYALDHQGHGQSEGERGNIVSLENVVSDLDAFADLVSGTAGGRPLFLAGHSMGGLIAVAYAQAHQDRLTGLVLSAPAVGADPALEALLELDEIPALPLGPFVSRDPDVVASYENDPLNYHGPMPKANVANRKQDLDGLWDNMGVITVPVLLLHGQDDALVPAQVSRDIAEKVSSSDVTIQVFPELYHEIWNEPEQEETIGAMVEWITKHVPA